MMKQLLFFISVLIIQNSYAQIEKKVPKDSLPSTVKERLHSKYHNYSVSNIMKAVAKTGIVIYKLEVRKAKSSSKTIIYDLEFNANGKLISKKKEKEFFFTETEKPKPAPSKSHDWHGGGHQH